MAFTAYRTWTVGAVLTAAQLNEQVRDNGNADAVATVTTAGDMLYATAANTLARLAAGAQGAVPYMGATSVPAWLAPGTSGQVLKSQGAAANPAWGSTSQITTVRKTAETQVKNNNTTLVTDDALVKAMLANEVWAFLWVIYTTGPAAAGWKAVIDTPASPTNVFVVAHGAQDPNTHLMAVATTDAGALQNPFSGSELMAGGGASAGGLALIFARIANGANAGNAALQWAQNNATVGDTKVKTGSFLLCWQES